MTYYRSIDSSNDELCSYENLLHAKLIKYSSIISIKYKEHHRVYRNEDLAEYKCDIMFAIENKDAYVLNFYYKPHGRIVINISGQRSTNDNPSNHDQIVDIYEKYDDRFTPNHIMFNETLNQSFPDDWTKETKINFLADLIIGAFPEKPIWFGSFVPPDWYYETREIRDTIEKPIWDDLLGDGGEVASSS